MSAAMSPAEVACTRSLLGLSQFYQPLAVGIVVVLAALLTRFQK